MSFQGSPEDKTRWPISKATETKGHAVTIFAGLAAWLADILCHVGERLFLSCDEEAYWRGWEITPLRGGLGRSYRDPRFDARHLGTLDEEL